MLHCIYLAPQLYLQKGLWRIKSFIHSLGVPQGFILKGLCTLKCPNSINFNIKIFLKFKFQICAYTHLKTKT